MLGMPRHSVRLSCGRESNDKDGHVKRLLLWDTSDATKFET